MMDQKEYPLASEMAIEHIDEEKLDRIPTVEIENYHGLTAKIVVVYISLFLLAFAQIITLVGAGAFARSIAATFGGRTDTVWLAQIVAIMICATGPPVAQATDYWGRKWILVIPTILGFCGSMIVARASSWGMVLGGQVIAALAFAPSSLVYAISSEILPRKWRPAAQGGINIATGLGSIFALLTGEYLVSHSPEGWRTYFYINGALVGLSALIFAIFYSPPPRELQRTLTQQQKLAQLDWIGFGSLTFGVVLFSMGLSWSQNPYPWSDPHVSATFAVGLALLIAFILYEIYGRKDGMFHHELFKKDWNFTIALICIFAEGMAFFAVNAYLPFEVSVLFLKNPILIGLTFCMVFIGGTTTSILVSIYSSKTKRLREPVLVAFTLGVVFFILMATAKLNSHVTIWVAPLVLGLSIGINLICLVTAAQLSTPPQLIATTTGLTIALRSLGGSIGLPIFNAIFNRQLNSHLGSGIAAAVLPLGLSPKVLPEFIGALASNNQKLLMTIPGITPQIIGAGVQALQEAYLLSFRYIWVAAGLFMFTAGIAACFIINPKKDLNMHVDAPLVEED